MTLKTFNKKDKKGREETWEWDETPESVAAIEQLHKTAEATERLHADIRKKRGKKSYHQ